MSQDNRRSRGPVTGRHLSATKSKAHSENITSNMKMQYLPRDI